MLSLRDLRFVLCSCDPHKGSWAFFILITHVVEKSDHVGCFDYRINFSHVPAACPRLVLCSRGLGVLRAQRIMGFIILITHKSMRSENPIT